MKSVNRSSGKKRLFFINVVSTFLLLNICAYVYLLLSVKVDIYDHNSYDAYKKATLFNESPLYRPSIVHPFIGKIELKQEVYKGVSSSEPLFSKVDAADVDNDVKVLILGGSVAMYVSEGSAFSRKLRVLLNTNVFSVYNAAFGGGKQPSQYFKLVYLDLLGFHPDIVVNIDGFNEIALPLTENFYLRNPAIYPRSFSAHLNSTSDSVRGCTKTSDRLVSQGGWLPLLSLAYDVYAKKCWEAIQKIELPWWAGQIATGDLEAYARDSARIWADSSNRMDEFTKQRNILYIHVLQPNQYFEGSKIFSQEEQSKFVGPTAFGTAIKNYYHRLSGQDISARHFYDQRLLFKEEARTVYNDNCCHFNDLGNDILVSDLINHFKPQFEAAAERKKRRAAE